MKQPEEFDTILDECLERILAGETVEACLARYPEHADELRPLLETSFQAKTAADVAPRPEFRQEASRQFQQALQNLPARKPVGTFSFRHWWVTAVVVLAIVVFGGGGTVFAANSAQPDNFLYPVKLATESVRISLAGSDQAKAELYAEFSQRRVDEIVAMADKGDTAAVAKATNHLEHQLVAMAGVVGREHAAANGKGESALRAPVATTATATTAMPTTTATTTPPAAMPSALAIPTATPAPSPTPPPTTVTFAQPQPTTTAAAGLAQGAGESFESNVAAQAAAAAQKLQDALNNAPEAAKKGLEHALDVVNNGYGKVLHGLKK